MLRISKKTRRKVLVATFCTFKKEIELAQGYARAWLRLLMQRKNENRPSDGWIKRSKNE